MNSIKTNFYVLTGGPGGGKSTLLEALQRKGYAYIDESARQIIKERLSKGLSPRPEPVEFALQMFQMDFKNFTDRANTSEIFFFDRSFIDSAALLEEADTSAYEKYRDLLITHRFNPIVFITPPWKEIYQNDSERDQTYEDSIRVYESLYSWYAEHSYQLLILPKASVETRVEFVLGHVTG